MRSQGYREEPPVAQPEHHGEEGIQRQKLIDQDPYGPSYHESAIKYIPYRIGILVFAVFMIVLGKSSLPSDEVPCLEDVVLDFLKPVTDFYIQNKGLGLTLVSIMQLIVDIQLIAVPVYWFIYGTSVRYPLVLTVIGVSKILLNVLFQTKLIDNSFNDRAFPSFVFGQNFQNTYFFSGVTCLLLANLLQFYEEGHKKFFIFQICAMVYVSFVLLSCRQNFFMDIATALVFTHYVYYFINDRRETIDQAVFGCYDRVKGEKDEQDHKRPQQ